MLQWVSDADKIEIKQIHANKILVLLSSTQLFIKHKAKIFKQFRESLLLIVWFYWELIYYLSIFLKSLL